MHRSDEDGDVFSAIWDGRDLVIDYEFKRQQFTSKKRLPLDCIVGVRDLRNIYAAKGCALVLIDEEDSRYSRLVHDDIPFAYEDVLEFLRAKILLVPHARYSNTYVVAGMREEPLFADLAWI